MILDQFWLTDAQFSKMAPHLPTDTRGKTRVDDRRVISGIVHVLKSGGRWIDAPPEYGPKKTLYNRYVRWAAKTPTANPHVSSACRAPQGKELFFARVAHRLPPRPRQIKAHPRGV